MKRFQCTDWPAELLRYTNWAVKSPQRTQLVTTIIYSWCHVLWPLSLIFSNLFRSHYYGWHERARGAASGYEVRRGSEDFGHHSTRLNAFLSSLAISTSSFNIQKKKQLSESSHLLRYDEEQAPRPHLSAADVPSRGACCCWATFNLVTIICSTFRT